MGLEFERMSVGFAILLHACSCLKVREGQALCFVWNYHRQGNVSVTDTAVAS